jgi:hypothetical protein
MSEINETCPACGQKQDLTKMSDEQKIKLYQLEQISGIMEQVFGFVEIVAREQQPYMTMLCLVSPDIGERKIHLWAGFGETPLERLDVKNKEIAELKRRITELEDGR